MNLTRSEGLALTDAIVKGMRSVKDVKVILAVPYPFLAEVGERIKDVRNLHLAAQNCHHEESGAFTGEVSAKMLRSFGAEYVIIGHSERRIQHYEEGRLFSTKMEVAIANGLLPIFCCGETQEKRNAKSHWRTVKSQVNLGPNLLTEEEFKKVIVAYEPVWAIGTGITATAEQAEEMHQHIRTVLYTRFPELAHHTPILYGGSVKPSNAAELFAKPTISGGLIGGASLVAEDFLAIVKA